MTEHEYEDVLAVHADALNRGEELDEQLLTGHGEQSEELASLFQLATALKAALIPVQAPAFKSKLGYELVSYGPPIVVLGRSVSKRKARAWLAVAAAGSLISAAGVATLLVRRLRTIEDPGSRSTPVSVG